MISRELLDGFTQYTLRSYTLTLSVMTLGATVTHLKRGDEDLALCCPTPREHAQNSSYANSIVGRYANRIRLGQVRIGGETVQLSCNEGRNQLHGGPNGFDKQLWTVEEAAEDRLTLSLCSPHGENGYPGELRAAVSYTLRGDTLRIDFTAQCDRDTIFAPTTHLYFTLNGDCLQTKLRMNAGQYLPVDGENLPLAPERAAGDFDFSALRPIGQDYDHCFIPEGEGRALLVGERTAIELRSDFPAMQLYTGLFLESPFHPHQGVALEPEWCPDSPNRAEFASPLLRAGERFQRFVEYRIFDAGEVVQ